MKYQTGGRYKSLTRNDLREDTSAVGDRCGKNYDVKGSGFVASRHANHLRMLAVLAPKPEQHELRLTKREVFRTWVAVVKNVLIEQGVEFDDGNVEIAGSLKLRVELFCRS